MNYIIEDNINFFDELNKIDKIDNTKNITDSSLCLLTHQTLEKNYITLDCSHNFNYIPLYKEICCQKMPTYLETTNLLINQIKCPYCRNITNKLLPFIKIEDCTSKRGVNYPSKYCMKLHTCSWYNKTGKNKNIQCDKSAYESDVGIFCSAHQNISAKNVSKINKIKLINETWSENHKKVNKLFNIKQIKEIINIANKNNNSKNRILLGGSKKVLVDKIITYNLINLNDI